MWNCQMFYCASNASTFKIFCLQNQILHIMLRNHFWNVLQNTLNRLKIQTYFYQKYCEIFSVSEYVYRVFREHQTLVLLSEGFSSFFILWNLLFCFDIFLKPNLSAIFLGLINIPFKFTSQHKSWIERWSVEQRKTVGCWSVHVE